MKFDWSVIHWTAIRFPLLGAGIGCLANSFQGGAAGKINAVIAIVGICGFVIVSCIKQMIRK